MAGAAYILSAGIKTFSFERMAESNDTDRPESRRDAEEAYRENLLAQFYSTLNSIFLGLESDPNASPNPKVQSRIEQLFEDPQRTWSSAYEIEQLLSLIMTEAQLDVEFNRRIEEAKTQELPYTTVLGTLYEDAIKKNSVEQKRAVLQRLLNDLQWFFAQRIHRRLSGKILSNHVSRLFFSAILFFVLILSIQFYADRPPESQPSKPASHDAEDTTSNPNGVAE